MKLFLSSIFLCLFAYCSSQSRLKNYFSEFSSPRTYLNHLQEFVSKNQNEDSQCSKDVAKYLNNLVNLRENSKWGARMFDSGTKVPSGILQGHLVDLGTFDECMGVRSPLEDGPIYGKYCLGSIPASVLSKNQKSKEANERTANPEFEMSAMFATCLPHSCSIEDFQKIYSNAIVKPKFFDILCQSELTKPKYSDGDIATICFLAIIFGIMILSTIYDVYLFYESQKPRHSSLIAFSVLTNGQKLFAVTNTPSHISCLHGLRVISMMWIILSHRYRYFQLSPPRNIFEAFQWMLEKGNMFIMGATVSVDTFLLLSGLVIGYGFMMATSKGFKFNVFIFYLHRYIRLTPVYAVIILLHVTLLKHLGSGPWWPVKVDEVSTYCENGWWAALLYIQNYLSGIGNISICIPHSWYLSVDTQLFVISPIILLPLNKWPRVGYLIAGGLAVASTVYVFVLGYVKEYRGFVLANVATSDFTTKYYIATHTRATPWLMGILLGYYIFQIKEEKRSLRINKFVALVAWAVALGILSACVFTGHNTMFEYDRLANAFYLALLRPGWAFGLSIVIILCVVGRGGPINWFLSVPVFQVLSRLTYTMYLLHMTMQTIVSAQDRTVLHVRDLNVLYTFWGDYVFTCGAAIVLTLAFESPIITIEKIIFGGAQRTEKKSENADQRNEHA